MAMATPRRTALTRSSQSVPVAMTLWVSPLLQDMRKTLRDLKALRKHTKEGRVLSKMLSTHKEERL